MLDTLIGVVLVLALALFIATQLDDPCYKIEDEYKRYLCYRSRF